MDISYFVLSKFRYSFFFSCLLNNIVNLVKGDNDIKHKKIELDQKLSWFCIY